MDHNESPLEENPQHDDAEANLSEESSVQDDTLPDAPEAAPAEDPSGRRLSEDLEDLDEDEALAPEPDAEIFPELDLPLPDALLNIDEALASVATLSDVIAQQEADEAAALAAREAEERAAEETQRRRAEHYFPRPQVITLERGQLISVLPALLLMFVGAWLTFTLTSSEEPVNGWFFGLLAVALTGVVLVAYWLGSGRWAQGAGFVGLALIFVAGVTYALAQTTDPGGQGWPLLISAVGLAMVGSALFSLDRSGAQIVAGLATALMGMVGMLVTSEALGTELTDAAKTAGPVLLVAILALVTLPGLVRRRG